MRDPLRLPPVHPAASRWPLLAQDAPPAAEIVAHVAGQVAGQVAAASEPV